ncbi:hypothetical protein ACHAXS_000296, partial [Conticribra weissflogii]
MTLVASSCKVDEWGQRDSDQDSMQVWSLAHGPTLETQRNRIVTLKFQDALHIWYGRRKPLDIESTCNRHGEPFNVAHTISCKKDSLVSQWHEEAKQEWIALSQLAYEQSPVGNKPIINHGCIRTSSTGKSAPALSTHATSSDPGEDACSNVFVYGFCKTNHTCIFDVHISDVHAMLNRRKKPVAVLKSMETSKKRSICRCVKTNGNTSKIHTTVVFGRRDARTGNKGSREATCKVSDSTAGAIIFGNGSLGKTADVHVDCLTSIPPPPRHLDKTAVWQDGS